MPRRRGIQVAPQYITAVKQACDRQFHRQQDLAEALSVSRSTVQSFLNGRRVNHINFVEISQRLGFDWQDIAAPPIAPSSNPAEPLIQSDEPLAENRRSSIPRNRVSREDDNAISTFHPKKPNFLTDVLVQQVRQYCHDKIISLYGKMQLLDVSQPVDVDNFYVEVNILEQVTSQQWLELADLLQEFNPTTDNFDRLGLGRVRQQRVPGLAAVENHDRLMVLGKPGSGKTTFLQHLAVECNAGNFQPDQVPIFIRLKNYAKSAKAENDFKLFNSIHRELYSCGISEEKVTETILFQGRGLILLDGLDEVPAEDELEVVEQIRQFSEYYYKNKFVITCRIAASQYRFTGFTEVEIADFNQQQIESFAQKWFVAVAKNNQSEGLATATRFIEKLNRLENQQVRELAVTPILLHLTCLVFQAKSKFPSNRAKLYEQGLDILLRKWDETRGIQRYEVYRALTLPHKKDLLAYLAAITFEQGYYFFEDSQIKDLIANYLNTLPKFSRDVPLKRLFSAEHLSPNLMDSEAVLQAIEAQHGLLVERARGIYSFSHLTFQEYFTARYFANRHQPQSLKKLVDHITDKRWREVFLRVPSIGDNADEILLLMKHAVDQLVATDEEIQNFLSWVNEKSLTVNVPYKPAAVRAFYFALVHPLDPALVPTLVRTLDQSFVRAIVPALVPKACGTVDGKDITVDGKGIVEVAVDGGLDYALIRVLNRTLDGARDSAFNYVFAVVVDPELKQALQELKEQLPNLDTDTELLKWWQLNGNTWREQLRYLMIKYRNIGHDWQLSQQQKDMFRQYYYANKLLVDCLNSSPNVTPAVRQEIEDTLLLPLTDIKKRSRCIDNQI